MGDIRHNDLIGVDRRRSVQANDLTGGMGAKFRRVDGNVTPWIGRVFFHLQQILNRVGVGARKLAVKVGDVRVVVDAVGDVGVQLMTTQVIEYFHFGAVLIHLPGEEVVETVPHQVGAGQQIGAL